MNGTEVCNLDVMGVLLGLPNGWNLNQYFFSHEEIAGESICSITRKETELKATIIHEESEE